MALYTPSFHHTDDYALLKQCLGKLTPTVAQIEHFCQTNPGWDWENFPLNPRMFPLHPEIKGYSLSNNVFHEVRRIVADSDQNSVEHSFFLAGHEHIDESCNRFTKLHYSEIYSNRGTAYNNAFTPLNQTLINSYNSKIGELILLGHTHPNYGETRKCFSICDILYGITNIMYLRHHSPQPMYKIVFAIAYTGNNGNTCLVPLMYDPSKQKKGGSAIFRLA